MISAIFFFYTWKPKTVTVSDIWFNFLIFFLFRFFAEIQKAKDILGK